jgi:hypothetical protein
MTADHSSEAGKKKQAWEPMTLTDVGHVGEALQMGPGKLTPSPADPGDVRKPPGQG